jgi:hypothetical protein
MRDLLLSDREWKFLEQLGSVLEVSLLRRSVIFTKVTFQMSRSKTPTLPWAIPMYQQMQESLHANLADSSLPPRMHRAIKKGLAKLGHYYDLAKLNHFNIIATSKCLHITSPEISLTINGSDSLPSSIMLILVQVD